VTRIEFRAGQADELAARVASTFADADHRFTAAKRVARDLGGQWHGDHATVAVWTPDLADDVPATAVELELFVPETAVDPGETERRAVTFRRVRVPTRRSGEFTVSAVAGVTPGTRDRLGALYQLRAATDDGDRIVRDPLAASLPFGVFAPAELYDTDRLDAQREDRDYFQRLAADGIAPYADDRDQTPVRGAEPTHWEAGPDTEPASEPDDVPRFAPSTSVLEIHPGTATESGSLAGLERRYAEIGRKRRAGEPLDPEERAFVGYDAVQLMPVEPVTENPERDDYWRVTDVRDTATDATPATTEADDAAPDTVSADRVTATVERPDQINWGYDVVISGFAAPNPAICESGRPDELVDLIATLHTLPEPKTVVFDVALGHAENRATELLPEPYFEGPGMYGMELDYTEPVTRAVLLELLRRKLAFGVDGVRIDGAQDFTNWDEERGEWHDDDFLAEMNDQVVTVAGVDYRPWLIYEDGRPWPRGDWELASTYRTLIEQHPHSFQWGPLTFAHNTPALLTFWASKWWRTRELADRGARWISGVANHDTLRRGSQLPVPDGWEGDPINPYLGDGPFESYREAYDGPAAQLLMHAFLPGVPMDFVHANRRAPWAFVRSTDPDWRVKVAAEEHNFLQWHVRPEDFAAEGAFTRLKRLGFETREQLVVFADALAAAVEATDDGEPDWSTTAATLSGVDTVLGEVTAADLEAYARAWMRDVHDYCVLSNWTDADPQRAAFGQSLREFRQENPWLRENLDSEDTFDYRHPTEGTVLYYGERSRPTEAVSGDSDAESNDAGEVESVLFVGNVEGQAVTVTPAELVGIDDSADGEEPEDTGADSAAASETDGNGSSVGSAYELALAPPRMDLDEAAVDASQPVELTNGDAVVFVRRSA
jgi:hypothetical protein